MKCNICRVQTGMIRWKQFLQEFRWISLIWKTTSLSKSTLDYLTLYSTFTVLFLILCVWCVEGHGVTSMVMLCWMWWKRNSKTTLKKWKTSAAFQEKDICPATQSVGQHLMMMKTFIQIFLVIRIIQFAVVTLIHFHMVMLRVHGTD